jgi:hypothetical protein
MESVQYTTGKGRDWVKTLIDATAQGRDISGNFSDSFVSGRVYSMS